MVRVLYKNGSKGSWEVIRFTPEAAFRRSSSVVGIAKYFEYVPSELCSSDTWCKIGLGDSSPKDDSYSSLQDNLAWAPA